MRTVLRLCSFLFLLTLAPTSLAQNCTTNPPSPVITTVVSGNIGFVVTRIGIFQALSPPPAPSAFSFSAIPNGLRITGPFSASGGTTSNPDDALNDSFYLTVCTTDGSLINYAALSANNINSNQGCVGVGDIGEGPSGDGFSSCGTYFVWNWLSPPQPGPFLQYVTDIHVTGGAATGTYSSASPWTGSVSFSSVDYIVTSTGPPLTTTAPCPAATAKIIPFLSGLSADGFPTTITAAFAPTDDGTPVSLTTAAEDCDVAEFDWQQQITNLPLPANANLCHLGTPGKIACFAANSAPETILFSPPAFLDPPESGYTYNPLNTNQNYPFYYPWATVPTGCAEYSSPTSGICVLKISSNNNGTLNFFDSAFWALLPLGQYMQFETRLVGVLSGGLVGPTYFKWTWKSDLVPNSSGGSVQLASSAPVDGTGYWRHHDHEHQWRSADSAQMRPVRQLRILFGPLTANRFPSLYQGPLHLERLPLVPPPTR